MENGGLRVPGIDSSFRYPDLRSSLSGATAGSLLTQIMVVVMYITAFLSLIWFAWGVFEYIFAAGNKDAIGKARKRMTWAIVGFVLFVFSFAASQLAEEVFKPKAVPVRDVIVIPRNP